MTSSKILFWLCISFVAGVLAESVIKIPQNFLWAFLFLNFLLIIIFSFAKKDFITVLGFCFLMFLVGVLRMQISEFNATNNNLKKQNGQGEVVFQGVISAEPDIRDSYQKLKVKIEDSTVLVTIGRYPEYNYLDQIELTGKLEEPSETDDFSYKNYLMKDHIYSVMYFPAVEVVSKEHKYTVFSYLYEKIIALKQKIRQGIQKTFLEPESSVLEGMILGDNGAMSQDLKDKLNITGLRHVISVSGTHVVIFGGIVMSLLLFCGFWRQQAFYVAIFFIFAYVVMTGLPASGIRAGIMGGIYLLAQKIGRQNAGARSITMAGALMLLINPMLLFYDVGFQLSFLAALGLVYFEPVIRTFFKFLLKRFFRVKAKEKPENLLSIISTTTAAQIFTLPIMVFNFGSVSWVSPITNILVLPIVSPLMIIGFLSSISGIFSQVLAFIFYLPCHFLLLYFLKIIDWFSKPWMQKTIQNVSWVWLIIFYVLIIVIVRFLNKKFKNFFV